MRPVLVGDVLALSRALLAVPAAGRRRLALRLISEAAAADAHRCSYGHAHSKWGDGSVLSRVQMGTRLREPDADNVAHLGAISLAAECLRAHLTGENDGE